MKFHPDHLVGLPCWGRTLAFLLTLLLLWLPGAALIYSLVSDANTVTILTMSLMFFEFLGLTHWWGRVVYQRSNLFRHYGLVATRQAGVELLQGLGIGIISLFTLFFLEGQLGWLTWQSPSLSLGSLLVTGLVVGLGVGLAEELVFRGWLLTELQQDYRPGTALWANSLTFACLHFIKPLPEVWRSLPQFVGLVVLGLALVWAKWATDNRLGLSIGVHAGLVWSYYLINVGALVHYTQQVPGWVTGINHNPLAGISGLVFLSAIALYMKQRASENG